MLYFVRHFFTRLFTVLLQKTWPNICASLKEGCNKKQHVARFEAANNNFLKFENEVKKYSFLLFLDKHILPMELKNSNSFGNVEESSKNPSLFKHQMNVFANDNINCIAVGYGNDYQRNQSCN